jgi:predicted ATP-dependent Lon-type protease
MPNFVAETRSPDHLAKLFANNLIHVAVVSRFQFPSPGTNSPKTSAEWFTNRYQIVTAENVKILPAPAPGE